LPGNTGKHLPGERETECVSHRDTPQSHTPTTSTNAITSKKKPCIVEGCDEPMIGLGCDDDPFTWSSRSYAVRLCVAHYAIEKQLIGLDPFKREVRRRRLTRETS